MNYFLDAVSLEAASIWECEPYRDGVKIRTTGLLPSFDPLHVYVAESHDGFIAHDGGDTAANMFLHGMESAAARRAIRRECRRSQADFEYGRISLKFETMEWLESAVLTVSNAATAAGRAAEAFRPYASRISLKEKVFEILRTELKGLVVSRNFKFSGLSGHRHNFDLSVAGGRLTLINTVTPHAASVNSKFVAFADIEAVQVRKIAVHDGNLSRNNIALLGSVATVAKPADVVGLVAAEAA